MDKIFNPFFTIRDAGKGTGQGVTLCYSNVKGIRKGSIDFSSRFGEGITCIIKLTLVVTEVSYE